LLSNADPAGIKVLVIDDSNTIRRSAEIFLKQGGYDVLLAEDGFDALSKVNDHDPDLIFCDILMPRLDGYQTCAIIKRNTKLACRSSCCPPRTACSTRRAVAWWAPKPT
jgi:twitching motility two-component system response regulator PilG